METQHCWTLSQQCENFLFPSRHHHLLRLRHFPPTNSYFDTTTNQQATKGSIDRNIWTRTLHHRLLSYANDPNYHYFQDRKFHNVGPLGNDRNEYRRESILQDLAAEAFSDQSTLDFSNLHSNTRTSLHLLSREVYRRLRR